MIRVRAGISYALTEAMDDGHCGLPTEELVPLTVELLEIPKELVQTALDLELAEGMGLRWSTWWRRQAVCGGEASHHGGMQEADRVSPDTAISAGNSSDRIQLPDCDLRQVAWQQISVHHAVPIRPSELDQTRVRGAVRALGVCRQGPVRCVLLPAYG